MIALSSSSGLYLVFFVIPLAVAVLAYITARSGIPSAPVLIALVVIGAVSIVLSLFAMFFYTMDNPAFSSTEIPGVTSRMLKSLTNYAAITIQLSVMYGIGGWMSRESRKKALLLLLSTPVVLLSGMKLVTDLSAVI